MKIYILSTDTDHHRYFINYLLKKHQINKVIFESSSVVPKFSTKSKYDFIQKKFEKKNFFKKVQKKLNKEVIFNCKNINSKKTLNFIDRNSPDLGIVFGTQKIIPKVIKKFKYGLINVHRGNLEKYRGLDSELWAIYHGDYKEIKTTIHKINEKLDNGRILLSKKTKINKKTKLHQLRLLMTKDASHMVDKILIKKIYKLKNKSEKPGRYYSFMPSILKNLIEKKFNKRS